MITGIFLGLGIGYWGKVLLDRYLDRRENPIRCKCRNAGCAFDIKGNDATTIDLFITHHEEHCTSN